MKVRYSTCLLTFQNTYFNAVKLSIKVMVLFLGNDGIVILAAYGKIKCCLRSYKFKHPLVSLFVNVRFQIKWTSHKIHGD